MTTPTILFLCFTAYTAGLCSAVLYYSLYVMYHMRREQKHGVTGSFTARRARDMAVAWKRRDKRSAPVRGGGGTRRSTFTHPGG